MIFFEWISMHSCMLPRATKCSKNIPSRSFPLESSTVEKLIKKSEANK